MHISFQDVVFAFLGGLGLFLFGLRFMSGALQDVAGDKMRRMLEYGTKNPIRGVLTGTLATALIQSSSATTVITVGLVNAQLLTLRQAIGIILGANIGTTITAYLIGLNLQDYSLPILGIGALVYIFSRDKKAQLIGQAILGFGLLFFGLSLMGEGMKPLKDLPLFINLMSNIENNSILGVIIGALFTMIVQSSSATIGVLQELAFQKAVTYYQAVPILLGDNIGTTVTALLAALGASVAARRAALTHFMFNVIGTCIFLPLFLLGVFDKMVVLITDTIFSLGPGGWDTLNIKLQIAQTHAIFNISNTIIHLPFVGVLAFIVTKLIPDRASQEMDDFRPKYINKRFLGNPSVALAQAVRESMRMGELARQAFYTAIEYFKTRDKSLIPKATHMENTINMLEREITDYLVLVSQRPLSQEDSNTAYTTLQSLNDIERIGDLCEAIMKQADYAAAHNVSFSGEAQEELSRMIELTEETLIIAMQALQKQDVSLARRVQQNDILINRMQDEYRRAHIRRLNEHICNGNNGAVFLDLLGNLERISAHCRRITGYILSVN
ncbi:MAG: Na/Pi cotransporter family protein [Syntrophomonadaceae bacterium]|jgi:phosphate:Na+ symporter